MHLVIKILLVGGLIYLLIGLYLQWQIFRQPCPEPVRQCQFRAKQHGLSVYHSSGGLWPRLVITMLGIPLLVIALVTLLCYARTNDS